MEYRSRLIDGNSPLVYIVILNWNGWEDTIECLNSVLQLNYLNYRIVLCDNDSQDRSLERIKQWLDHRENTSYFEYNQVQDLSIAIEDNYSHQIILISTGANLGFAGGNNIGIRYALSDSNCAYVWILNNDTTVHPDSLNALVTHAQLDPNVGICGSKLIYYYQRDQVQAWGGGKYNKWFGVADNLGMGSAIELKVDALEVEKTLDFVMGASMLVSRSFINDLGLMNEQYFLCFEELDWIVRAKGKYKLGYADRSIVYHKEGGSTGNNSDKYQRSYLSDYYNQRSYILFTRTYYPYLRPFIYLHLCMTLINRIRRKQFDRIPMIWKLVLEDLKI
jgi:GT2 family glycosyltransferase